MLEKITGGYLISPEIEEVIFINQERYEKNLSPVNKRNKPAFCDQAMKFGTQHLQIVYIEIRNVAKVEGHAVHLFQEVMLPKNRFFGDIS